ncbi:acetoacetate decarboxylase family protein [Actinopolyspora halophila]|uniref:acetoacetate decarboxylase family protein n=1 Tax=Actinopolyspora halophila TaxID=1850 RepID=UPI000475BC1C|nr:acetoacetate decarboxylase family protein [Actinopolyspora halophila]
MSYPPSPWRLCGELSVSLWRLPRRLLPAVPEGLSPVLLGEAGVVGTAWVLYRSGSVLEYNELLVAVLVRRGARLRACLTQIWVDSAASLWGGRALWGIPKERAEFGVESVEPLRIEAHGIASASMTDRVTLPKKWPLGYRIAQSLAGDIVESRVRVRGRMAVRTASWHPEPDGPLGWLHGRRPFVSLALHDFEMRFGAEADPPAQG